MSIVKLARARTELAWALQNLRGEGYLSQETIEKRIPDAIEAMIDAMLDERLAVNHDPVKDAETLKARPQPFVKLSNEDLMLIRTALSRRYVPTVHLTDNEWDRSGSLIMEIDGELWLRAQNKEGPQ